ncbi:ABC transporter substrate-binding protein [Paenibacillus chungangensis]|uniref:ABC transporter substrate-binding protein n=1 Tax=Paenibacillus chungangensis TaxID=696535 RepID=A0ABW3HKM2_9BACL
MKKSMKRWLLGASLTLSIIVSGCANGGANEGVNGGANNNASQSKVEESKEPVTITMWEKSGGAAAVLQDLVKQFNEENKDINIDLKIQGGDDYEKNLPLAFQSKQAPDVFTATNVMNLYKPGWLLALDDVVNAEHMQKIKPYITQGINGFDGKAYAIPTSAVTMRLVYNKDLFKQAGLDPEQPPQTFSQVAEAAKKITEASGGEAYGFGLAMKWTGFTTWQLEPLALTTNDKLTKRALFNVETGQYDIAQYQPVIELYRNMVQNKWVYPGASTLDNDPMRSAFADGKIGMYIGASFDVGTINDQFNTKIDWAATNLPYEDGKTFVQNISNVGRYYAVNAETKHPEEAAKVIEFLTGVQMAQELQKQGLINSILPETNHTDYMPQDVKQFKDFAPTSNDRQSPSDPTPSIKVQGKTYTDVVMELVLTDKPIEPALKELNDRYNEAYNKAVQDGAIKAEDFKK